MTEQFPRDLVRGSLDLVLLSVLAEGPKYGYLIQKRVHEVTAQKVRMQAGTLYPLLHRLEADHLIRSRGDDSTGRQRKWYEITSAGRHELNRQAHGWRQYVECIGRLLAPIVEAPPDPA